MIKISKPTIFGLMAIAMSVGGLQAAPQIHGKVFQDRNCDGIHQPDEPLIPGVAVDLLYIDDRPDGPAEIQVDWTSTSHNGTYSFTDITPGAKYMVHFVPPKGVTLSPRNQGNDDSKDSDPFPQREKTDVIVLGENEILQSLDAGLCLNGTLSGYGNLMGLVFLDDNANGVRDDHESVMPGIDVELYAQDANGGSLIDTYSTNDHGEYMFSNIQAGISVFVKFIIPVGYNFTMMDAGHDDSKDSDVIPAFGRTESFVLSATEMIGDLDAGIVHTPAVEITQDGHFDDWNLVNPLAWDARDMKNAEDKADWEYLWVTHHGTTLSLSYSSYNPVSIGSAYNIFLDTNFSNSRGFEIGDLRSEYLIQGDAIYKYEGTGRTWVWKRIGTVETATNGNRTELCFSLLVIGNPFNVKFLLYGDNNIFREGGEPDFLPDTQNGIYYSLRENQANKPPFAYDDTRWTMQDVPVLIPFEGHDPEGFEVFFSIASQPVNGSLEWEGKRVVYHPNPGFTGSDSFQYTVNDGQLESSSYSVDIHVLEAPADHCPTHFNPSLYVDGLLDDWNGFAPVGYDPADIHLSPFEVDWRQLWLAHDDQYFYFATTNDTVPFENACTWAHTFFIDVDNDAHTGFRGAEGEYPIGAELMLQGAFLFRYTGSGTDWSWDCIDAAAHATVDTNTELRIDRWHIGFDTDVIRLIAVGFNEAFQSGAAPDLMPDHLASSFCYRFANDTVIPVPVNAGENEADSTRVYRQYGLTVLARKPAAANSANQVEETLEVILDLDVADGQTWAFQRSFDLENWETFRIQKIREKSIITLDPEASNLPENAFYRAVLVRDSGTQ